MALKMDKTLTLESAILKTELQEKIDLFEQILEALAEAEKDTGIVFKVDDDLLIEDGFFHALRDGAVIESQGQGDYFLNFQETFKHLETLCDRSHDPHFHPQLKRVLNLYREAFVPSPHNLPKLTTDPREKAILAMNKKAAFEALLKELVRVLYPETQKGIVEVVRPELEGVVEA